MKKTVMTIAIVLGLAIGAMAQGGGLFERGEMIESESNGSATPMLPLNHGSDKDHDAAPLGSGVVLLAGLGAAYLVGKKRRED